MQPKTALVTGVTGFLGSHLAWRLLERGYHVRGLARGSRNSSARDRAFQTLELVAPTPGHFREVASRLDVVEGDISRPDFGIAADTLASVLPTIDEVWHCAASLSFTEENRDQIFKMNVDGAEKAIQFTAKTRNRRLLHVSTAYVAGLRKVALESEIDTGQEFRNAYEESKCQAEVRLEAAMAKGVLQATIFRPAVVIGESDTGRATHFHGVYAFIRGLWAAGVRIRRKSGGTGPANLALRVPGSPDETLNFVPIDFVVNAMAEIGARESSIGGTYHLSNPEATRNGVWLPGICDLIGVEGLRFVSPSVFATEPPTRLEAFFQKQMAFYYMYLQGEPRFDCRNTLAALEGTGIACPSGSEAMVRRMVGWYVDVLNSGRDPEAQSA